jgi:hypothetical protein
VVDAAHGSGDPSPKPDSATGAAVAGSIPVMTEPVTGASSSQAQQGTTIPETLPEVDTTTTLGSRVLEVLPTGGAASASGGAVIPDFASKIKYSSHVCAGSFIPHTDIKCS